MTWKNHVSDVVEALNPGSFRGRDFAWGMSPASDEPTMTSWNEERLGPLDMATIQALAEEYVVSAPVPVSVTRAQALMALYNVDLLDEVEAALVAHPYPPVRIWFNNAMHWERSHVYLQAIGAELGLDDDQIDDLFRAAVLLSA